MYRSIVLASNFIPEVFEWYDVKVPQWGITKQLFQKYLPKF